jgi:predicted acyl esterase
VKLTRPLVATIAVAIAALAAAPAQAAQESRDIRFEASDGVSLEATLTGEAPLTARPTLIEFSPYGRGSGTLDPGPAYNSLLVQIRGTGSSDGRFDALGPRTQADVAEVVRWACDQPWSDGNLALNGFSASAITIYNSLHHELPCVRAGILKSGTHELYRDLIWPGGIANLVPATGVMALIGAPALAQGPDRLIRDPASGADVLAGLAEAGLSGLAHETLDGWWRERRFRGNANDVPFLIVNGFFDVESRGAFEGYRELRSDGAHLYVVGAHDGAPAGTDAGLGEARAWLDHHVRGIANGVTEHPRVQLWLADGRREDHRAGRFVRADGDDWPLPGTSWERLALGDGSLLPGEQGGASSQATYPALPSFPTMADVPTTALAGAAGLDQLSNALPMLTQMNLAGRAGLTFTTPPLREDVLSAGPAALDLRLASTAPETGIWAVISDVGPDGAANPMAVGRLSTAYPRIRRGRSLRDPESGAIVQPYGRFARKDTAAPGTERRYRVEFWPVGNRFKTGHRIRLDIVGASAFSKPGAPALNTIRIGGRRGSRLYVPQLPGSDIERALSAPTRASGRE